MNRFRFSSSIYFSLALGVTVLLLATSDTAFTALSLDRLQVFHGEVWRIITGNFVHFGWAHMAMNLAAFLICVFALFSGTSLRLYVAILVVCCVGVGLGIYFLNLEYDTYAGLSGAIHGLIVAGLLLNRRHSFRVNGVFIALVFAKIIYEHLPGYQANELQSLLPVAVAYDAHLYGALSGLLFGAATWAFTRSRTA